MQDFGELKRQGLSIRAVSVSVTARDGRALVDSRIQGKVRFFGENLSVTSDLAKRIAKVLRKKEDHLSSDPAT